MIVSRGLVGWVGERERPVARSLFAVAILCLASIGMAAAPATIGILVLLGLVS